MPIHALEALARMLNMNMVFINKIWRHANALFMQPKAEESFPEVEAYDIRKVQPRSFALYEQYSGRSIAETIRMHRECFEHADIRAKRELEIEVKRNVRDFRAWLEKTKNLEPIAAHYYSISLKSLLIGLPVGVQVAQLFGEVLDRLAGT